MAPVDPTLRGHVLQTPPSDAYRVTIQALPRALPEQSDPDARMWAFAYTITITNTGQVAVQLIARHWHIADTSGHHEEVKGLGVVGQQPLLKPGESFQYTSGCRLRAANGAMHGSYFFVADDGTRFDAPVDPFVLDASANGGPVQAGLARVLH